VPGVVDRSIVFRRAILLHALLTKFAPQLRETDVVGGVGREKLNIDSGLVEAFLCVQRYRYGARSMESIIKMSSIAGRTSFDRSSLAPSEQLAIHVAPQAFLRFVSRGTAIADDADAAEVVQTRSAARRSDRTNGRRSADPS